MGIGVAEAHSPLEQFEIERLFEIHIGGVDVSFTNSGAVHGDRHRRRHGVPDCLAMRQRALVPTRLQSMAELSYEFVANMIRDNVGTAGMQYFPFIFTLFMFILFCNLIGMIPFTFTVTSHIIVTFAMALVVFIGVTVIGFVAPRRWASCSSSCRRACRSSLLPLLVVDRGPVLPDPARSACRSGCSPT